MEILYKDETTFLVPTPKSAVKVLPIDVPELTEDQAVAIDFKISTNDSAVLGLAPVFYLKDNRRRNVTGILHRPDGALIVDSGVMNPYDIGDSEQLSVEITYYRGRLITRINGNEPSITEKPLESGKFYLQFGGGFGNSALMGWRFSDLTVSIRSNNDDRPSAVEVMPTQSAIVEGIMSMTIGSFLEMIIKQAAQTNFLTGAFLEAGNANRSTAS